MNLAELQKEAHAIAQDQGWYDTESTFGNCIADVHAALSRALEAYQAQDIFPDETADSGLFGEVAEELADVVIRVADMAEHRGVDLASLNDHSPFIHRSSFGEWVAGLHYLVSMALYWHEDMGITPGGSWEQCLRYVLSGVLGMAARYDIDLDAAIAAKMEYNRASPHRQVGGGAVTSQRSELITVNDGHTPCWECPGYIDTQSEAFIALVIPMKAHHQWRGVATFHPECYLERDPTQSVYIATGVHEGKAR